MNSLPTVASVVITNAPAPATGIDDIQSGALSFPQPKASAPSHASSLRRKCQSCKQTKSRQRHRSSLGRKAQSNRKVGVEFPEYEGTQAKSVQRLSSLAEDSGVLRDLPDDALQEVLPHIPTIVVNRDQLLGVTDGATYRQLMSQMVLKLQQELVQTAEEDGYGPMAFTPSHVHPLRDQNSGRWPMHLAALLVQAPEKADLTNELLLHEVAVEMGVRPFAKSYMSKSLTKRQRFAVAEILKRHGYTFGERQLKTGTDIRRVVQAHLRRGMESATVDIRLKATTRRDSISIAGNDYALHPRRGKPKGDPLVDLEMNVGKHRIPLGVAMKLLGLKDTQVTSLAMPLGD